MNTKWTRLAAILWLSTVVLATWVGVNAAKNESSIEWALNNQRPQMEMRQIGSGDVMKHPKRDWFGSGNQIQKEWKWWRFWFAFIDEESLTDVQKSEIEKLQEERDEAIKKINDEFFDKLEKFISEEKLEDYENFVANHENMKWMKQWKWNHKMRWENWENPQGLWSWDMRWMPNWEMRGGRWHWNWNPQENQVTN